MTSSILAGERRWATARRGGMTVLGKVAVPKPLNLPSQRLENHGLDPSVEIVPKGTLSWGSRPSSSGSNAWGTSSVSPNADGGIGSSSQLSGRPSSGSGTRPSTAGSERSQESAPSAWGQSSRPSSASGALNSNQTALASLRPRSADTRPGSSQLSRFAESSSDNSVAWGPTGGSDKLGLAASKNDGFSLSSGDFPTLGSEKDNCGKSIGSKDQGSYARPSSSSSRAGSGKGEILVNANVESGTVNTWNRDDAQHEEDVSQPDVEKWQAETQPYLNVNIPPQQFDAWRGPPVNPPGVWYRGPPQGPPYGTPLGPGGFPVEPFHYYHPPRPVGSANSQEAPASGMGPKGHGPNSREAHRPHNPDAYLHPGMPLRPGFYPGSMACEGYYGPPMGYCNSNEQNRPFMGMSARPSAYNSYHGENAPDLGNNNARSTVHGSMRRRPDSGQVESGHPDHTRGPSYKVLTKHHTESDGKWLEDKRERATPANAPYVEKGGYHQRASFDKHEWEFEDNKYGTRSGRTLGDDAHSKGYNNRGNHRDSTMAEFPENREMKKPVVDGSVNRSESAVVSAPQVSRESLASPKDPMLIQKIEVLNAKARTSGSDNRNSRIQEASAKTNSSASEAGNTAACYDRTQTSVNFIPSPHDIDVNKPLQPPVSGGTSISRRGGRGTQERFDNRGKSFNRQDAEGRGKTHPLAMDPSPEVSLAILNDNVQGGKQLIPGESAKKSGTNGHGKDDRESFKPMSGTTDSAAQRTKTREIANQRAKKLQKDEEDRIAEQEEKARAKLEELNQRARMTDVARVENASPRNPIQHDQEKPPIVSKIETLSTPFESGNIVVGEFTVLSRDMILATSQNMNLGPAVLFGQPLSLQQDARTVGAADSKAAQRVSEDDSVSRHKRTGVNQKQNSLTEKPVQINPSEAPKREVDAVRSDVEKSDAACTDPTHRSSLPKNSNVAASSTAHQSKTNRSNKNKHKLDKPPSSALPSAVAKETKVISETSETKDTGSVQSHVASPPEQRHSLLSEAVGGKANGQWNSRRMPRQQHAKKMEKLQSNDAALIWAPVRTQQSKAEVTDGTVNTVVPDVATATKESDGVSQKDTKGKRVEMERYVPKPVAKELAQQGASQRSSQSSVNQTAPASETGGSTGESRNVDGKRNKPSKAHGLWRPRGLVESESGSERQSGSSSIPNSTKNLDRSSLQSQSFKPDSTHSGEEAKSFHDDDGWNMDFSEAAPPVTSTVHREVSGRGHRHQPRAHRNFGNTQNHSQTDRTTGALKENQGAGQRTSSQWQPKSQAHSAQTQSENRPSEGHNVGPKHMKASREGAGEYSSEATSDGGHQGSRRERQAPRNKGRPRSPNLHADNTTYEPSSQDTRHEERVPSGSRNGARNNNRFDCLVDEDQSSVLQHNTESRNNQESQRFDSQNEYQAVGQYDNRSRNFVGQRDGFSGSGRGYKDRNHRGQARRGGGNSRGWRGATVHADSGYNNN